MNQPGNPNGNAPLPVSPKTSSAPVAPVQIQSLQAASTVKDTGGVLAPIVISQAPTVSTPEVLPVVLDTAPPFHAPSQPAAPPRKNALVEYWRKAGGGSFLVSLGIHAALLVGAYFVVETIVHEKKVDFLPGGGSKQGQEASQQMTQQVQSKRRNNLQPNRPMQRIVSNSASTAIALPDTPLDAIDMPQMSSLLGGGSMGSGGFGDGGSGGGFGKGMGLGGMNNVSFKPIFMFGKDLKARSIGVVMDVSGSMTPHLTKVIKELDRVAKGSPVVLYVGCGVATPGKGVVLDDNTIATINKSKDKDKSFEEFWRRSHKAKPNPNAPPPAGKKKDKDAKDPIPEEAVYQVMAQRPETFFIKSQGIEYSWLALMAGEFRHVDALYWFSDFQDKVDDKQIERVSAHLRRRKQKLFMHASVKGKSFEKVRDLLVLPSGGEVIEEEPPKK